MPTKAKDLHHQWCGVGAGLATLDNSVSPEQLVFGLSDIAGATKFAILLTLGRM